MTVLVCGATGTTGSALLRRLRGDQVPVRALTRSEQSATRLREEGAEAVVADLGEPATLAPALDGVEVVYVASPPTEQLPDHEGNLAVAAAAAGVKHIVKLSVNGAAADSPLTFGRLHFAAEEAVRAAGPAWTMLRPTGFMQNTLAWAGQIPSGRIAGPVMQASWGIIDVRDIAAVADAVIKAPAEHAGATYSLTGPELSSPHQQVEILAELLEQPLESVDVPIESAQEALRAAGVPAQVADWLGELWRVYADGGEEGLSPDVERVAGRPPYSYRQFAEDHRTLFLGA